MQRRILSLLMLMAVTSSLLVGCGGTTPPPPPEPQPPTGLTADRAAAAWGDPIVLTGENLGTAGTLLIGGTPVTATSWEEGKVTLTVPSTAPAGPQTLTLTTEVGSQTIDLFVGVDFPTGTLEDLAALALPKGTAVRLGEGTFTLTPSADPFTLDNLSLYGQGEGKTVVATGDMQFFRFLASEGYELTIADLTLRTDATLIVPDLPSLPAATAHDSVVDGLMAARGMTIEELVSNSTSAPLAAQALPPTSVTIRRVKVEPSSPAGVGLLTVDFTMPLGPMPMFYTGDLLVEDVSVDALSLLLMAGGTVDIERVVKTAPGAFGAASITSHLTLSKVEASSSPGSTAPFGNAISIMAARGTTIVDSALAVEDGDIMIYGALPSGALPIGGPSSITGTTLTATDSDPGDGEDHGSINLGLLAGSAKVAGNTIAAQAGFGVYTTFAATALRNNVISVGSADYPDTTLEFRVEDGAFEFSDNKVTFESFGGVVLSGGGGSFSVTDNTLSGFAGVGTALSIEHEDDDLEVGASGNRFTDFGQALHIEQDSGDVDMLTARINGNVFDFIIDTAPKAALVEDVFSAYADLDATDNVWGTNTSAATVASYITYALGDPGTLNVTPIRTP